MRTDSVLPNLLNLAWFIEAKLIIEWKIAFHTATHSSRIIKSKLAITEKTRICTYGHNHKESEGGKQTDKCGGGNSITEGEEEEYYRDEKSRKIKMLVMIMLTITTEIRVIMAMLVLMKIIVYESTVTNKGMSTMTSMINQIQYSLDTYIKY